MTVTITSPVTGSAQTGFTAPTYTHVVDSAVDSNIKQYAVTALGGTQAGVTPHSVSSPFTLSVSKPKQLRSLGMPAANGYIAQVPNNIYRTLTRKGVVPAVNQPARVCTIDCSISVPAGADTYDAANIRAAISAHIGVLQQISAGLGDTTISGVL